MMSEFAHDISGMSRERLALVAQELHDRLQAVEARRHEPIAIIGMSCRCPGAEDVNHYWRLLRNGVDAITETPASRRWNKERYYDPNPDSPGRAYIWEGGFLNGVDQFDPHFFGISPREAVRMDPQQRLLMESVWEALENAGQPASRLEGSPTGIFVGISTNDFLQIGCRLATAEQIEPYSGTGTAASIAAGRLSYALGLQGPNFPVDTACSSSLVALHLACQSLRSGESRTAVTTAVNLMLSPETTVYFCKVRALSPDGRCKAFDAQANGYVRSEGLASVVLKRLSHAQEDGDRILAVIRGSAVNHDGRTSGLTVPNRESQERVIRTALANANVQPGAISYVEAHGTGTPLGDPIEVQALSNVFADSHDPQRPLLIGSAKTNVGHAEAAAGLVGLIKVVLSLQHQQIPAHLHFRQPNPYIPWAQNPVEVVDKLRTWEPIDGRRLAGLSSFGFSGTNAHVILEQAPAKQQLDRGSPEAADRPCHLLALSAKSSTALQQLAQQLEQRIADDDRISISDVCHTTGAGRSHFTHRWAASVSDRQQALEKLRGLAKSIAACDEKDTSVSKDGSTEKSFHAPGHAVSPSLAPKVAFLFTGQGSQYVGMGQDLFQTQPTFRDALLECEQILQRSSLPLPITSVLFGTGEASLHDPLYTTPALFALEYALARLWLSWGVKPAVMLGNSTGEFVAATLAGVFQLEDGLQLVATLGRLMQQSPRKGAMVAVAAEESHVATWIQPFNSLAIAAVNAPRHIVVSGARQELTDLVSRLTAQGITCRPLQSGHAFHSPLMDDMLPEFARVAATINYSRPQIGMVSSVTGELADGNFAGPDYWCQQVRQPVQFMRGLQTIDQRGYRLLVEVGPTATLVALGRQTIRDDGHQWSPSLRQNRSDWTQMLATLRKLYLSGVPVDWPGFDRDYARRLISLPTYPFQRQQYVPDFGTTESRFVTEEHAAESSPSPTWQPGTSQEQQVPQATGEAPTIGTGSPADWLFQIEWKPIELANESDQSEPGCWLIFADDQGIAQALSEQLTEAGHDCVFVLPGKTCETDDTGRWQLDPEDPDQIRRCLGELVASGRTWRGVVYLWCLSEHCGDGQRQTDKLDDLVRRQRLGVAGILHLVQGLAEFSLPGTPRLTLVTRGTQAVFDHDVALSHSPVWGFGKVIFAEHPLLRCKRVDLEADLSLPTATGEQRETSFVSVLNNVLLSQTFEDQLAIRGEKTYVPRLVPCDELANADREFQCRSDATYLITGGLGGLGLLVARWLIAQGARQLTLIGRSEPKAEHDQLLADLQNSGAEVEYVSCDVCDAESIATLFADIATGQRQLRGIVHAAGVLDDDALMKLNWSRFRAVMRPKLEGSWNLHAASRELDLDFFVCFSSIASLLGSPRQANYAAANAFQDSLSHYRQTLGLPSLTINWGPWSEAGMAARLGPEQARAWAAAGIGTIDTDAGLDLLGRLLISDASQACVVPADWSRVFQHFPPGLEPPILRELAQGRRQVAKPSEQWLTLKHDLRSTPTSEHYDLVAEYIAQLVTDLMELNPSQPVDYQTGFFDLGMDSLMAVDLRSRIQSDLGYAQILPVTFILDHPTVEAATAYLLRQAIPSVLATEDEEPVEDARESSELESAETNSEETPAFDLQGARVGRRSGYDSRSSAGTMGH